MAQDRKDAHLEKRREQAKALYTLNLKEIEEDANASLKLHMKLEEAALRKYHLMTQRKEKAAYCSAIKPKTTSTDNLGTNY